MTLGEPGTCDLTQIFDPVTGEFTLRVDHADPRIWVTPELLDQMVPDGWPATFNGDVMTINGVNRRVIYRIGRYLPEHRVYEAEWPD
jgi:hypothetical protein